MEEGVQEPMHQAASKSWDWGLPSWSSGQDSALPVQGAWARSLVGELYPTGMVQLRVRMPQLRPGTAIDR